MQRVTKRCNGIVAYVGASNTYETGQIPAEVDAQGVRELLCSLAAYEDTRLTAEEVAALQKEWSDLCTVIGECGGLDRIKELAKADKEAHSDPAVRARRRHAGHERPRKTCDDGKTPLCCGLCAMRNRVPPTVQNLSGKCHGRTYSTGKRLGREDAEGGGAG